MDLNFGTQLLAYCGINVIYIYTAHCFVKAFFKKLRHGYHRKYILSVALYYVAAVMAFLLINNAYVNMMVSLIFTFFLSLCYKTKIYNRVIAILFLNILVISCEAITLFAFKFFSVGEMISPNDSSDMLIMVMISKLVLLLVMKILEPIFRIRHHKKSVMLAQSGTHLFLTYWLSVLTIPIASAFVMMTISFMGLEAQGGFKGRIIISILLLLLINTLVFYLYDKLLDAYATKMQNLLLTQQVEYHLEQYQQIKKDEELIFELKHNLKNQMLGIVSSLQSNSPNSVDEICKNVNSVIGKIGTVERTVHTGIEVIDTIINYKAEIAAVAGTVIKVKSDLRQDYPVDAQVVCVILGNALDNAIDACRELSSDTERVITIRVSEEKRSLYMSVKNPCSLKLELKNGFPVTTKKEKSVHGIGLRSIDKVVRDYGGIMTFGSEDGIFELGVILYNKHPLQQS